MSHPVPRLRAPLTLSAAVLAAAVPFAALAAPPPPAGAPPAGDETAIVRIVDSDQPNDRAVVVVRGKDRRPIVLDDDGHALRGFLGVELAELTPELREHFGAPHDRGVMVSRVEPDSPAAQAGIKVGDILTSIGGEPVDGSWEVTWRVRSKAKGDSLPIELTRDGKAMKVTATVAERERREVDLGRFKILRPNLAPGTRSEWHSRLPPPEAGEAGEEIEVDPEVMGKAFERLHNFAFETDGSHGDRFFFRGGDRDLEKRLEELEKRLDELQKELDKTQKGSGKKG